MLIECPECHNKISDKADICIHCGFPLNKIEIKKNNCNVNGTVYDLSNKLELITNTDFMQGLRNLRDKYNLQLSDATTLGNIIKNTKQIPPEYNSEIGNQYRTEGRQKIEQSKPKCPHCNSTNISHIGTGERAASIIGLGIFSKKINKSFKCKSCGYTW